MSVAVADPCPGPAGLSLSDQHVQLDGLQFQLVCGRRGGTGGDLLAEGGRHRLLLARHWDQLAPAGVPLPAAGAATVSLDLLTEAAAEEDGTDCAPFQVVITGGGGQALQQVSISRRLRSAGIAVVFHDAEGDSRDALDETARWAAQRGAVALVYPDASGERQVRVRPLQARRAAERVVHVDQLVSHLGKLGIGETAGLPRQATPPGRKA